MIKSKTRKQRIRKKKLIKFLMVSLILSTYLFMGAWFQYTTGLPIVSGDLKMKIGEGYDLYDIQNSLKSIKSINRKYIKTIKEIDYINELGNSDYQNNPRAGRYRPLTKKIEISVPYPSIMIHEIAHHIQDNHISSRALKSWIEIHNSSEFFVSDYAKWNYLEDFATSLVVFYNYEVEIRIICKEITLECLHEAEAMTLHNFDDEVYGLEDQKILFFLENIEPSKYILSWVEVKYEY